MRLRLWVMWLSFLGETRLNMQKICISGHYQGKCREGFSQTVVSIYFVMIILLQLSRKSQQHYSRLLRRLVISQLHHCVGSGSCTYYMPFFFNPLFAYFSVIYLHSLVKDFQNQKLILS